MSRRLVAANILSNRFDVYEGNSPIAHREDANELWVFNSELCSNALKLLGLTSRRQRLRDIALSAGCDQLAVFYERWMMYTDGPHHHKMRRCVLAALRSLPSESNLHTDGFALSVISERHTFELVSEFCEPWVWHDLPRRMGLCASEIQYWRPRIEELVRLPGLREPTFTQCRIAETALEELRRYIMTEVPQNRFSCALSIEAGGEFSASEVVDVTINVVGDGIHPTVSGLAGAVHYLLNAKPVGLSSLDLAMKGCAYNAPFQYVARTATTPMSLGGHEVKVGDRVVACIGAASRCDGVNSDVASARDMAFGAGRHACPGRTLALDCIASGLEQLLSVTGANLEPAGHPTWLSSIGYHSIQHWDLRHTLGDS